MTKYVQKWKETHGGNQDHIARSSSVEVNINESMELCHSQVRNPITVRGRGRPRSNCFRGRWRGRGGQRNTSTAPTSEQMVENTLYIDKFGYSGLFVLLWNFILFEFTMY